jgi:hypothetical protein
VTWRCLFRSHAHVASFREEFWREREREERGEGVRKGNVPSERARVVPVAIVHFYPFLLYRSDSLVHTVVETPPDFSSFPRGHVRTAVRAFRGEGWGTKRARWSRDSGQRMMKPVPLSRESSPGTRLAIRHVCQTAGGEVTPPAHVTSVRHCDTRTSSGSGVGVEVETLGGGWK